MSGERNRFSDEEVVDFVRGLDDEVTRRTPTWGRYARAYRNEFWSGLNPWSELPGVGTKRDPFPVKVESNQVWPFVQAHTSNLFFRSPRTEIDYPAVVEVKNGRPMDDTTAARRIIAFSDEWIKRSDIQELSTYAMQLAMFHGVSAYKLGLKPDPAGVMDRVWVDVVPFWELLWDDRARSWEQQAYRGHIRYERVDRAEEIVGVTFEDPELEVLPDVVEFEGAGQPYRSREQHAQKYVRLLEFYDLLANEQRFYLVSGRQAAVSLKPVGKVGPIPWELASGRPGVPIIPVILSNEPEFPLKGVSSVARVYQLNAETNLMLTIIANMMRRDAARISVMKGKMPDALVTAIEEAVDGTVVKLPDSVQGDIKQMIQTIEWGRAAESLDKYRSMLVEARQDSQGMSDLLQGKQGKYLSATEAEILAGSGETTALEIGTRMAESMSRAIELVLVMFAGTMKDGDEFAVRTDKARERISKAELEMPWTVGIVDSGATPVRLERRKKELNQIAAPLLELVRVASAPDPDPAAAAAGAPAEPPVPEEVRSMARQLIDYTVMLFGLPDSMSWSALNAAAGDSKPKPPDAAKLAKAQALMDRAVGVPEEQPPINPQGPQGPGV